MGKKSFKRRSLTIHDLTFTSPAPNIKGGWMTRVMPPRTRTRLTISKTPHDSLRKRQERRVTNTWGKYSYSGLNSQLGGIPILNRWSEKSESAKYHDRRGNTWWNWSHLTFLNSKFYEVLCIQMNISNSLRV